MTGRTRENAQVAGGVVVLAGESAQVERGTHEPVRSGVVNAGGVFELRATAGAQDSTYAEIGCR
ncbi:hypothetical protein [Streptomyces sp. NPDC005251]|uniref:hypothetical protein n=1 Tax=unclassified Streptomyces TaxID=2593676 RepID=UPI0033BAB5DF